ncbi:DUF6291 domain-containing protein [Clostridium sp. AF27-5AA]|jgi:hypothetical protein|uniref:DUF6291 domain-containing protein n=1 Tax=Clostridium sp. AF27-5AA TaxID=2293008 RepID=UPI000E51C40B|nr:DUF6291 domain-containing protein [Clostridium sp. AF27-5AA]RHQ35849.1 hypothetical protein DWY89_02005 [Clostridium sp. AF27-5AA]DAU04853.1 MAG TPA: hypothetical protein [Caudoviricetes sp.]
MADKKSFVMYESWGAAIEKMNNEQAGELIKAIYAFQKNPDVVPEDPAIAFVFEIIKQKLEEDNKRYEEVCAARSEGGKKGGRPKANASDKKQMVSEESKKSKCFSEKAKKADNDNEYDNDLKENTLEGVKEKRFAPPTLENVSEYCREMGYTNVDAVCFIDFYTSNGWMVGKNRMKDWKAAVRNWDRREKNPQRQDGAAEVAKKNRFHNLEEHGYDYDAMVWGMVGAAAQGEAGSTVKPGTG